MMGNPSFFHDFKPCSENFMVRIVDGSMIKMVGIGFVLISKNLVLKSILFVPDLACNLLSVSKLMKDLTCVTNFCPTHCNFQDLESRRMIVNAKLCMGLYLLRFHKVLINKLKIFQGVCHFLFFLPSPIKRVPFCYSTID